mgnify:CR=1 FL=1
MKAGETKRGEVYVGTEDNQKIRGYVTSSSRRVVPGMDHISGTTVRLPLGIDTVGLAPGENLKGWLCFTTNIGEARLPFEIEIEKEEIRSFSGVVGNLDEFVKVARDDFKEAFRIFKDASFTRILENEDQKIQTLYYGLSRQPVTYQHLEGWLNRDELARLADPTIGARVPHTAVRILSKALETGPVLLSIPQDASPKR